jgi:hypothetical protein
LSGIRRALPRCLDTSEGRWERSDGDRLLRECCGSRQWPPFETLRRSQCAIELYGRSGNVGPNSARHASGDLPCRAVRASRSVSRTCRRKSKKSSLVHVRAKFSLDREGLRTCGGRERPRSPRSRRVSVVTRTSASGRWLGPRPARGGAVACEPEARSRCLELDRAGVHHLGELV